VTTYRVETVQVVRRVYRVEADSSTDAVRAVVSHDRDVMRVSKHPDPEHLSLVEAIHYPGEDAPC